MSAVKAWIDLGFEMTILPRYLVDYLRAGINYYKSNESLTSIILANIALETLIAEMWEETFKSQAPDIPLGALKNLFQKKKPGIFAEDISDWIDRCNTARIKSVHRGGGQPSSQEALDSIRGLVKISLGYFQPEVL